MRFLLAFVFSFISTFVLAQAPPMLLGGPQGIDVTRIVARNWMNIPIMTDTPSAPLTGSGWPVRGFIVHVAKANDTSVWQYTGARWARIGGVAENNYTQLVSGGTVRKNQTTNRFQVTSSTYYIKGVFYSSLLTNLNGFPKTANANGRIDIVALESSGPVVIQGVESGNPVAPSIGASRISLAIAYYPPFDTLPVMSGNGLISVFREPGVDSLFFVTRDTVLRVRDSVGKPVAGNLIDVSRDTVAFGDTMIKNTIFNTNGYTYRILKAGGDTLFNITPPGDILLKGRTVGDSTGVFSVNIKGNRVAFIDSIQWNESFEPKMLVQYTPNRPGVTVYPVGVFGGINGENRAAVNTISGDANVGAFSHTALGGNATGSSITFLKDRTSTSNYRRGTGGTNLQPNDVALDISASGGHYVSALSTASYKGLGGIRIVVDSLFGTNYRSNMRFFTNDASTQFATEKMRLTNTGNLIINRTTDSIYKLDVNGDTRISGNTVYNGNLSPVSSSAWALGLTTGSQSSRLQSYVNGGASAVQYFDFGFNTTQLVSDAVAFDSIVFNYNLSAFKLNGIKTSQRGGGNVFNELKIDPTIRIGTANTQPSTYYGVNFEPIVDSANNVRFVPFSNTIGSNMFNTVRGNTRIGYNTFDTTFLLDVNGDAKVTRLFVNTTTIDTSAAVNIVSTTKGFLQPRMTNTQRDAITAPATGLQLFSTTDSANYVYRGTGGGWQKIANEITKDTTIDFPSTGHGTSYDVSFTVTGAELGDVVSIGIPHAAMSPNISYTAWVSAANQVTIRLDHYASSGNVDPASGTFKVKVFK